MSVPSLTGGLEARQAALFVCARGHRKRDGVAALIFACFAIQMGAAAEVVKTDTATMQPNTVDWSSAPTAADTGVFNNVISAPNAATLTIGANALSIGALKFQNNLSAPITIMSGSQGLILNNSGLAIDMSAANQSVEIQCPIQIASSQTWNVCAGKSLSCGNVLSGMYALRKEGLGTLTLSNSANSISGEIVLASGTLNIQKTGALGFGAFRVEGGTVSKIADGFAVTLTNASIWNGSFATSNGNSIIFAGPVTLGAQISMTNGGQNILLNGPLTGVNALSKYGGGQLLIGASNSFSGGFNLRAGTLFINHNHALGSGMLTIFGGALNTQYGSTVLGNNPISWNGDFTFTGTQNLHLGYGTVTLNSSRQVIVSASTLTVGGSIIGQGSGLTKAGPGTLVLAGTNTYSGETKVTAGRLVLGGEGSISNSASMSVGTGAVFDVSANSSFVLDQNQSISGSGTITGMVTTASGATIYPGGDAVAGTLTFTNNLDLSAGGVCWFDLSTTATGANDRVVVGGDLKIAGNKLRVKTFTSGLPLETVSNYILFKVSGSITGSFDSIPEWEGMPPGNASEFSVITVGNEIWLHPAASAMPPAVIAAAYPIITMAGGSTLITATVTPGESPLASVHVNASMAGGSALLPLNLNAAGQYTNTVVVSANTPAGNVQLLVTVTDMAGLTSSSAVSLTVLSTGTITLGTITTDSRGVVHVPVISSFQGNSPNNWRIILPSNPPEQPRQFMYLMPVDGESTATTAAGAGEGAYGDNIEEALRVDLANRYNAIIVCPKFSMVPWYADHPSDAAIKQESYFLQAFPVVEALYPQPAWTNGHPHRVLAGFSKSGWGVCSLGARYPQYFDAVVPWDAPLVEGGGGNMTFGLANNTAVFGTTSNYYHYQISANLSNNAPALRVGAERFGMFTKVGTYLRVDDDSLMIRDTMDRLGVPNTYVAWPNYLHRWYSGWVDDAARYLNQGFRSLPDLLTWSGAIGANWNLQGNWTPATSSLNNAMIAFSNTGSAANTAVATSRLDVSAVVHSLQFANSASYPAVSSHNIQIDPGVSLMATGSYNGNVLQVGSVNAYVVTHAGFTGSGMLKLDNANADFKVRSEVAAGMLSTHVNAILDLSSLSSFEARVRDFLVGAPSGFNTCGEVTLSRSNYVIADRVLVGAVLEKSSFHNLFATSALRLGATNTIFTDVVNAGYRRSGRGTIQFLSAANPTLVLRGKAGGNSTCDVKIGYGLPTAQLGTGTNDFGSMDLTSGNADLRLGTLLVGSSSGDNVTGWVALGSGNVYVENLVIGQVRAESASGIAAVGAFTNQSCNVAAGTVTLGDSKVAGCSATGTLVLNGGCLLFDELKRGSGAGVVLINGGCFGGRDAATRIVTLPIRLAGLIELGQSSGGTGSLIFGGDVQLAENVEVVARVPVIISGSTKDLANPAHFSKSGSGVLTMSGNSGHTGSTVARGGLLIVNGSQVCPVMVNGGALRGNGTFSNSVTIAVGRHEPGDLVGSMDIWGNYDLAEGTTLSIDIAGTLPGITYDQLNLRGSSAATTLNGNLELHASPGLSSGTTFNILSKAGSVPISGSFAWKPQGFAFQASGYWWRITYVGGDGNDIAVTIIPPPAPVLGWTPQNGSSSQLTITGERHRTYYLEASTNLLIWQHLTNLVSESGTVFYHDWDQTNLPARFYRATMLP